MKNDVNILRKEVVNIENIINNFENRIENTPIYPNSFGQLYDGVDGAVQPTPWDNQSSTSDPKAKIDNAAVPYGSILPSQWYGMGNGGTVGGSYESPMGYNEVPVILLENIKTSIKVFNESDELFINMPTPDESKVGIIHKIDLVTYGGSIGANAGKIHIIFKDNSLMNYQYYESAGVSQTTAVDRITFDSSVQTW